MATICPEAFVFEGLDNDDGVYRDFCFTDRSPNRVRRLWRLSVPYGMDNCYTTLRRSETDDGEFGDDIYAPIPITDTLLALVPNLNWKG